MIKSNLAVIMAKHGVSIQYVADNTGLSRTTIAGLCHNTSKGIQFSTMDVLCNLFNVTPGELLTYSNPKKYRIRRWSDATSNRRQVAGC